MVNKYGIKNTCKELDDRLLEYIESEYLGKNNDLWEACKEEIRKPGILFQEPYVEVSQSYATYENGLESAKVSKDCKTALFEMSDRNLGVFKSPYCHQMDALNAFCEGKDVFVSTGTGSGKTECFMWSIVSKLIEEGLSNNSWDEETGVRILMMYPMNALVTDQLGRLRRMIGNEEFRTLFRKHTNKKRIPRFGMYTGRTLYPGDRNRQTEKEYAETLTNDILKRSEEFQTKLKEIGRYPAKKDLHAFVDSLGTREIHIDNDDSELLLRYEMQKACPDILITNYSMLELMLIRPIEQPIWKSTKEWLKNDLRRKLLFVIDEAHMYRGSSGGEVALLIRRVMNRLEIPRDRIQFILTSASIPEGKEMEVMEFANALTSQDEGIDNFKLIRGTTEEPPESYDFIIEPEKLIGYDPDLIQNEETIYDALRDFSNRVGYDVDSCDFSKIENIEPWLFDRLSKTKSIIDIQNKCRGNATRIKELSTLLFPEVEKSIAEHALDCIFAVTPLAKNKNGRLLLPSKLHLFFRGMEGIYACINPQCSEKTDKVAGLGKIYLRKKGSHCACGGRIFEILNDRICGGLFVKAFIDTRLSNEDFIWDNPGSVKNVKLTEVHFSLGTPPTPMDKSLCIDSHTGKIFRDDSHTGEDGYITLTYRNKDTESMKGIKTFVECPYCDRRRVNIIDFSTKGNAPFYNLVSKQLSVQPPTLFSSEEVKKTPNKGRKVLLFSDSRQNAATLAENLSKLSIEESMRATISLAAKRIMEWGESEGRSISMKMLYVGILKIILEQHLNLFIEDTQKVIEKHIDSWKTELEDPIMDYNEVASDISDIPGDIAVQILNQLCDNFRSLTDLAIAWIEPESNKFKKYLDWKIIGEENKEEIRRLFTIWATYHARDSFAIDYYKDDLKYSLQRQVPRYGIPSENILKPYDEVLKKEGFSNEQIDAISKGFTKFCNVREKLFISNKHIALHCDIDHDWLICRKCSRIAPFKLFGKCGFCGSDNITLLDHFDNLNFLRKPVVETLNGNYDRLNIANVEEHTAQLSHKDQRDKLWSTTEDYELRFQNIYVDDNKPVDILSCTTTMEVGIDIGSLTAVGLRNVPPSRENYQQRAGRAGRRSASVSTIVTYADRGPYDHYYFTNPDQMVSGDPRTPRIDFRNEKLAKRHVMISILSNFFRSKGVSLEKLSVIDYIDQYHDSACRYLAESISKLRNDRSNPVLPSNMMYMLEEDSFTETLIGRLKSICDKVIGNESYYEDSSLLEMGQDSGLFPTYSFPRYIIGFSIYKEENKKLKIEQQPDRQLDIAISEFAPGREVMVNKKLYVSGGISAINELTGHPKEFEDLIKDTKNSYRDLFVCENESCGWFGFECGPCPFCGENTTTKKLLTPNGFSPLRPYSRIKHGSAFNTYSYARQPCYSSTMASRDGMTPVTDNLHIERRADQKIIVMNSGNNEKGFTVCSRCGAAVMGDDDTFSNQRIDHPILGKYCDHKCDHLPVYLGYDFLTDLVVYEITLNPDIIESDRDSVWLKQASTTLAQAMGLAAGLVLGAESTDLNSGYRIIDTKDRHVVEIYLYDNLSSGAGYSSELAEKTEKLLDETRRLLNCKDNCESACFTCLKNYNNRFSHNNLDRFSALELLDWAIEGRLTEAYTPEQQDVLLQDLRRITKKPLHDVCVYPGCWSEKNPALPKGLKVSSTLIKKMMPLAYSKIMEN